MIPFSAYRWSVPLFSVTSGLAKAPPIAPLYASASPSSPPFLFHRSTCESDFSRLSSRVVFGFRTTLTARGSLSMVQQERVTVNRTSRRRDHQEGYMSNRLRDSNRGVAPAGKDWGTFS